MGELLPHQHTVDPSEDSPSRVRDYHSSHPFKSAIKNRLTSYRMVSEGAVGSPVEISDGSMRSPEEVEEDESQELADSPCRGGASGATSSPGGTGGDQSPMEGSVHSTGSDSEE